MPTLVRCANCRLVLDEPSNLSETERSPCPGCASSARHFEVEATSRLHLTASVAWEKVHEEVERSWLWLLASLALTLAGTLIGYVVGGILGLLLGFALGLLSFPAGLRWATKVREIERGGSRSE